MNWIRVYNSKGAKWRTPSDLAKKNKNIPVQVVELLYRKDLWERKISMADGMQVSQDYYSQKLITCIEKLKEFKDQGYYVPESIKELPEVIQP